MNHSPLICKEQNIAATEVLAVILLVFFFALFPLLSRNQVMGVAVCTIGLTVFSWLRGWIVSIPIGVFCSVCLFCVVIEIPFSQIWLSSGLIVYIVLCKNTKHLIGNMSWLRLGRRGRDVYLPAIIFVLLAAISLIFWFIIVKPNINDLIDKLLPDWNCFQLVVGGLLFSMTNAAVEEGAYRGVIMQGLDKAIGAGRLAIAIQAAAFGMLHINGFPRGWLGIILASIFGVFMGIVRRRANGMLAPWIAHVLVDIVIICIVAVYALTT